MARRRCPHSFNGDPRMCSMCLGAVPRIVTHAPGTGTIAIDDKVMTTRRFVATTPIPRNVKKRKDPTDVGE